MQYEGIQLDNTGAWFIDGLNQEQKESVLDASKVIIVNAGPGTGKTHLLVHKMLYYLKDNPDRSVVALSFTNAAANQLGEKLFKLKGQKDPDREYRNCKTATIHSYCFALLSEYFNKIGSSFNYEIVDESDIPDLSDDIIKQYGIPDYEYDFITDILEDIIANGKRSFRVTPEEATLVKKILQYKKEHHIIAVDEILDLFIKIVTREKSDEHIPESGLYRYLNGRIDCLLVDESQDLSAKIYNVLEILLETNPQLNLFLVGDPRQNIFRWNGGSYENLKSFINNTGATISEHNLTTTYRCPTEIVRLVNPLSFIDCQNPSLVTTASAPVGNVSIQDAQDKDDEVRVIVNDIKSITDRSDACVLCSGLWYLENVARELNLERIPFIVRGGKRFMMREFKIINCCLRYIFDHNADITPLKRYYKDSELRYVQEQLDIIKSNDAASTGYSLPDMIMKIYKVSQPDTAEDGDSRLYMVEKYAQLAKDYPTTEEFLFACTLKRNDEFAEFYRKDFNVDCHTKPSDTNPPILLSTIHSAKGLEFNDVILAGTYEGMLPSYRAQTSEEINDERKKYYVAVTRSKKNLYITYPKTSVNKYGRVFQQEISRFIAGLRIHFTPLVKTREVMFHTLNGGTFTSMVYELASGQCHAGSRTKIEFILTKDQDSGETVRIMLSQAVSDSIKGKDKKECPFTDLIREYDIKSRCHILAASGLSKAGYSVKLNVLSRGILRANVYTLSSCASHRGGEETTFCFVVLPTTSGAQKKVMLSDKLTADVADGIYDINSLVEFRKYQTEDGRIGTMLQYTNPIDTGETMEFATTQEHKVEYVNSEEELRRCLGLPAKSSQNCD